MRVSRMTRRALGWILLCEAMLCGLLLTGCRKSEEQKAKETAQAFFRAANADDAAALKATLTQQARRNIQNNTNTEQKLGGDYTLEQAVVTDDTAQVFFTLKEEKNSKEENGPTKGHLKLRREEGEWRVYAMTLNALPGGGEFTINFENPAEMLTEIFRGMGRALGEGFKAMGEGFKEAGEQMQREAEKGHAGKP